MMREISIAIMITSAFLASVSQTLLKQSANKKHTNLIYEYINKNVIIGYSLLILTMILNMVAYQSVEYKLGPIINSFTYVFVLCLGVIVFHEKLTKNKVIGVILILSGIAIYNL